MEKPTVLAGRVWVIADKGGELIDDVDTDQIFHNAYLHITEMEQMGKYAFSNLEGWKEFPQKVKPGDILVVGRNFGAGSSRQQAVDCFLALGIPLIIGESFGAIYKRNAINAGMALFICEGLKEQGLKSGHTVQANLETGEIKIKDTGNVITTEPLPEVLLDIYKAGGLFAYARTLKE